jgi:hypothetical protein
MRLFRYREEGNPPVLRPTLDVRLRSDHDAGWTTAALIDTGAPITFFDNGVAQALNLRLGHTGAETDHVKVLGGTWKVQFESIELSIPGAEELSWETRVAFACDAALQMPFQGVLGSRGFLERLAVTFNEYENYFVIEPSDAYHDRVGRHLIEDVTRRADENWRRGPAR